MDNQASDLNGILTRLLEIALDLGRYQRSSVESALPSSQAQKDDGFGLARAGLVGIARRLISEADARDASFPVCGSSDPVWRMMLDLYIQTSTRKLTTVSDASVASRVPSTTALRWIAEMVEKGLLVRFPDPHDRRRAYVDLSDQAYAKMSSYLASIAGIALVSDSMVAPRAECDP